MNYEEFRETSRKVGYPVGEYWEAIKARIPYNLPIYVGIHSDGFPSPHLQPDEEELLKMILRQLINK